MTAKAFAPGHPALERAPDGAGRLLVVPVWYWKDEHDPENMFVAARFGLPEWVVDAAAVPFFLFGSPFRFSGLRSLRARESRRWAARLCTKGTE